MIERVKLSKLQVLEIEGEYKEVRSEEREIPCMLTNYAIAQGKRLGLLKSSVIADLLDILGDNVDKINSFSEKKEEGRISKEDLELVKNFDEDKAIKIIYIGCLGANPNLGLEYDEFLQLYNENYMDTLHVYINLTVNLMKNNSAFAKEFESKTSKRRTKGSKK